MRKLYFLAILFLAVTNGHAQGTWSTMASLPATGRAFSYVFSIGDTGYVCGGANLGTVQSEFWAYVPATNTWIQKTTPPFNAKQGVCFVVNNKAYLCTGMKAGLTTPTNEVWEFDPSTGAWSQKNNFPGGARISAYSLAIGSKGYLGGGSNTLPGGQLYDFWEYVPATDTWTQIPNYPITDYFGIATFEVNGIGYFVGGFGTGGSATIPTNNVWSFNPSNNQWTAKNDFPVNVGQSTGFTAAGSGYIVNGTTQLGSNQTKINDLYKYDSATDSWSMQTDFPSSVRSATHVFVINNMAYAGHGLGLSSAYYVDWYRYVPTGMSSLFETPNNHSLLLSPNPATSAVQIISEKGINAPVVLMDLQGRIITRIEDASEGLNVTMIPDGIYLVEMGGVYQRLVVRH